MWQAGLCGFPAAITTGPRLRNPLLFCLLGDVDPYTCPRQRVMMEVSQSWWFHNPERWLGLGIDMWLILVNHTCRENSGGHWGEERFPNKKEIYGEHPPLFLKQIWSCLHRMPETAITMPLNMRYHRHIQQSPSPWWRHCTAPSRVPAMLNTMCLSI